MITREELLKVPHLARLELKEEDIEPITNQMSQIIDYIETLNELNLEGIKPTAHAVEVENVFREPDDTAVDAKVIDKALEQAPKHDEDFFMVPRII